MKKYIATTYVLLYVALITLKTAGIVFDNIRIRRIQKKRKAAEKKYRRNLKLAVNYAINDYYAEVGR